MDLKSILVDNLRLMIKLKTEFTNKLFSVPNKFLEKLYILEGMIRIIVKMQTATSRRNLPTSAPYIQAIGSEIRVFCMSLECVICTCKYYESRFFYEEMLCDVNLKKQRSITILSLNQL